MFKEIAVVLLAVALSACASSDQSLRAASASSLRVAPDRIAVADIQRGMMDVTWTANANGRRYACIADDMVRRPSCVAVAAR